MHTTCGNVVEHIVSASPQWGNPLSLYSLYVAFASELLSPLTPHVCYLVLPHLLTFDLPLEGMIHAILGIVERGSVAPTPELLYAILQMVHSRLGEKELLDDVAL